MLDNCSKSFLNPQAREINGLCTASGILNQADSLLAQIRNRKPSLIIVRLCFASKMEVLITFFIIILMASESVSAGGYNCFNSDTGAPVSCSDGPSQVNRNTNTPPSNIPPNKEQIRQQEVSNLKVLSDTAMKKGNWEEAVKYFRQVLVLRPNDASIKEKIRTANNKILRNNAVSIHNRGIKYLDNNDYERAINLLEQALQEFPLPVTKQELKKAKQRLRNAQIDTLTQKTEIQNKQFQSGMEKSIDQISDKLKRSGVGVSPNSALNQLRQVNRDSIAAKGAGLSLTILKLNAGKKKSGCTVDGSCPDSIGGNLKTISTKGTKPVLPAAQGAAVSNDRVIRALEKKISSLDRQIKKTRDPRKKQKLLKSQIFHLNEQSQLLADEIPKEKDPVKRVRLIDKQSAVNSKKATQEIKRLDLSIKFPGS